MVVELDKAKFGRIQIMWSRLDEEKLEKLILMIFKMATKKTKKYSHVGDFPASLQRWLGLWY